MKLCWLRSSGTEAVLWGLATAAARLPFTSRLPYHWDSVQFILAMSRFDMRLHQPHPPGYLLYVWSGRLLLPLAGDAHRSLIWLSILSSGMGAALLFQLAEEMFGRDRARRPARTAGVLFLTAPVFWFFGEVALTYMVDFALVAWIALYALRVSRGDTRWRTIVTMSASLGLAGGVRATTLLFMAPLCLLAAARGARGMRVRLLAGAGIAVLMTVAWCVPTVEGSGGWNGYRAVMAAQRDFVNQTAVWTAGWSTIAGGLTTHTGCLVNALGAALLPLALALYLRLRPGPSATLRGTETEHPLSLPPAHPVTLSAPRALKSSAALFLTVWVMPSALFYLFVHFGSPGYSMTYLGAVLLAVAWLLEPLWWRLGRHGAAAALAGIAAVNAWTFLLGTPLYGERSGFGVLTRAELRSHDAYWQQARCFVHARFHPGDAAILVPPSFTDGLRTAQYVLPEYWPATGLAIDPKRLAKIPASLKPGYFRYVTPDQARRDGRPILCLARVPEQVRYFRSLFGTAYRPVAIGGGMEIGSLEITGRRLHVSLPPSGPVSEGSAPLSRSNSPPRPAASATLATSPDSRSESAS